VVVCCAAPVRFTVALAPLAAGLTVPEMLNLVGDGFVGDGFVGDGFVGDGFVGDGFVGDGFVGDGFEEVVALGPDEMPQPPIIKHDMKSAISAVLRTLLGLISVPELRGPPAKFMIRRGHGVGSHQIHLMNRCRKK